SREAIMQSIGLVRDERAAPLFAYILGHIDHRGALAPVYLRAIESLGALRDPAGIAPLRDALYRGEWWAPRRTAALRGAVALALARIDTPESVAVLEEVIVDDMPMARADTLGPLVRRLQQSGVDRITVDRGVTAGEIATFVSAVTTIDARNGDGAEAFPAMAHIRVGRVTVEQRVESSL